MKTWSRPSPGGRRLSLQRKFELNVAHYGGNVSVLTITAPGEDVLPWDTDQCDHHPSQKCSGEIGCRVEWIYAYYWNATAQARMSRLFEAAQKSADRWVRRQWAGELPRQIGNVGKVMQKRGVYHFHYGMPNGSEIERVWSRHVRKFLQSALSRENRLGAQRVWDAVEREFAGEVVRGVYGFGFSHPGRTGGSSATAARYLARNAAGYLSDNAWEGGRHYVSSRITRSSGVTMKALRSCNYMFVRQRLGEPMVPPWWNEERTASVLRVWALIETSRGP
jgi:hypothetical protein